MIQESGKIITDWTRGFSQYSQANVLRRTQSHPRDDDHDENRYGDGDEYDHLADTVELERRAAFQKGGNDEEEEDEQFGEFITSNENVQWSLSSKLENLDITTENSSSASRKVLPEDSYVRAVKTKEEENQKGKAVQDYYLDDDEEQHGEV